jgi:glyoxylase I family protein
MLGQNPVPLADLGSEMRGLMHHLDITLQDVSHSALFYEPVLTFMGYRRSRTRPDLIGWDLQAPYGVVSVDIRAARTPQKHDRYSCGLHHFAWHAESRDDVDRMYALLVSIGATVLDTPAEYPRYGDGYYAVFFADPDGLKFEFVHFPG